MEASTESRKDKVLHIAVVGNPNTGKSTLFNNLTGLRQRTGNYPGVTVTRKVGLVHLKHMDAELVDLPGTYSLSASSPDERVVIDALNGRFPEIGKPDAVLFIADAANLRRNLFLASQVATLGLPMVMVLNHWDTVAASGQFIDLDMMRKRLKVPVIASVAAKNAGTDEVKQALESIIDKPCYLPPINWPNSVNEAVRHMRDSLPCLSAEKTLLDSEVHRLIFDSNSAELSRLQVERETAVTAVREARDFIRKDGVNPLVAEALLHYRHIDGLIGGVILKQQELVPPRSESIDRILLHRGWGLIAFIGMMYVVFQSVYTWAGPIMDVIDAGKGWLQDIVSPLLAGTPMLQSLMVDGVIEGVGAFLIFLPQILILFVFISLLEDSGYMARAAFIMDKLFSWCGLNGKSFVPLLSSYACAIPGIMATRTIEDPKSRLATVFVAPLMSCSARLPVYILCIGAFIEPRYGPWWAGFTLFAMHFIGLAIAVPTAWVVTKFFLKSRSQPFVMELPKYHAPRVRDVLYRVREAGIEFIQRAGSIIFVITIVIWALLYFPHPDGLPDQVKEEFVAEQVMEGADQAALLSALEDPESDASSSLEKLTATRQIEQSYMGRIGHAVQPIFAPAGFDWKISVGVLSSYPAREVIISTLGIMNSLGGDVDEESGDLRQALKNSKWQSGPKKGQPVYTIPVVVALMVFFALCSQCGATTAIIIKEAGIKWAVGSFVYMTALAWIGAVLCYQFGSLFT